MASEIRVANQPALAVGSTAYFVVRNASGQVWNTAGTPAFENFNAANWTDYDVALTEQGSTGYFIGSFPSAISAGLYSIDARKRAGGSPAVSDTTVGVGTVYWDGSALVSPVTMASNVAAVLADTNELQTDWANGGRLDLIVDAILDDTGTSGVVVSAGSITSIQSGLATAANLATVAGYIDTEVASILAASAAIQAKTDNLPASPAASTDAAAAIVTYGLDHLVNQAVVGADIADNSIVAKLASKSATADWDSFTNTTDSLEAIRDNQTSASVTFLPISTTVSAGEAQSHELVAYKNATNTYSFVCVDDDDEPIVLTGHTVVFRIFRMIAARTMASILSTTDGDITIGGANANTATVSLVSADVPTNVEKHFYRLQDTTTGRVLSEGTIDVRENPTS